MFGIKFQVEMLKMPYEFVHAPLLYKISNRLTIKCLFILNVSLNERTESLRLHQQVIEIRVTH